MDVTTLALAVDSRQVNNASAALDRFSAAGQRAERNATRMEQSSQALGRALGAVTAALSVAKVVQYADAYQQVNARLRLVTGSQEAFTRVQGELVDLADRTRVSLTSTIDLYGRLARSTKNLAASDTDRLQVTEAINKALIVSGAAGASAEAALIQLGQGFASGTLRGEELNSVMEQTPRLAQAIADGLGITIGQLRELGQAGKLTSQAVFQALQSQAAVLDAEFSRIPVTIGQALTVAENRLQSFIGGTSDAAGAGRALAGTIDLLSRNIDVLAAAAAGFATVKIVEVLTAMGTRVRANVAAVAELAAAQQAQRAAAVASAQAEVQRANASLTAAQAESSSTAAKIAGLRATEAAIVAARADTVAKLQSAQAAAAQAAAQINAAKAAGALSFALAAQREGVNALAAAQARQVKLTTELAVLGQQQARVQASITAATNAQAAASANLTAALSAQTTAQAGLASAAATTGRAMGVLRGVLGALGGPIGLITTALSLGASAWILWGDEAEEAGSKAERAIRKVREAQTQEADQLARLDALISKLRTSASPDQGRIARLENQRAQVAARLAEARTELQRIESERARNDQIARNEVARRVDPLAVRNNQRAAFEKFMEDNATDTEKFQKALRDAKRELGEFFTPEVERRLRERFLNKGAKNAPDLLGFDLAEIKRELEGLTSAYSTAEAILEAQRQAALVDERTYYDAKRALIALNADAEVRALEAENARLARERGNAKERMDALKQIADNEARIAVIRAEASSKAEILSIQERSAAEQIAIGFREAEAAAQSYLDTLRRAQQNELDGLGLGSQERDRRAARQQIEDRYEQQRQQLESERRRGQINQQQYDEELARIKRFQEAALESFESYYEARRQKEADASVGISEALRNYVDEANNTAKQLEDVFTNAFKGLEDALVDFVMTGKLDFKSLADSIVADITRIVVKQSIIKPMADYLLGGMGGGSGAGGAIASFFGSLFGGGRATGGSVSAGRVYEVNERGRPEMLNVGGRQYLMPTQNGTVSQAAATAAPQQTIIVQVQAQPNMSRQTAMQQGRDVGAGIERATRRNG